MSTTRRFNPWMWLPLMVIGAAAIANLALILVARRTHVSKVEDHPWLAAERIDQDKLAAQAFADGGGRLAVEAAGQRITCRLLGPPAITSTTSAQVRCYRPSDAALDRLMPWPDTSQPISLELPAPGRWEVQLLVQGARIATHALSLSP
ncbi:MAG: FixH family protein [Planctomycetes bacterium]|nr:FixH family protein [Planctomycetota bacterium]